MLSVIGEGWRHLATYLPLSNSALQNGWSIVFKTSLLFWVALMRSRCLQSAGHYLPTDYTDLHCYSAYLCSSVLVRGRNISPCPTGRNLNNLNQVSCFYSWDSLDFSSAASRRIYIFCVSVPICAICGRCYISLLCSLFSIDF